MGGSGLDLVWLRTETSTDMVTKFRVPQNAVNSLRSMCFVAYYRTLERLHSAVGIVIRLWAGSLR